MVLGVVLAAGVLAAAPAPPAGASLGNSLTAQRVLEGAVVAQLNFVRRTHGLPSLWINPSLNAAAAAHSRDMVANGFFDHDSSDGSPFSKRLDRFYGSSGRNLWSVGENILWAAPALDAKQTVTEWMESSGHRENILSRTFREIGIGVVSRKAAPGVFEGDDVMVVTTDFGVRR